MSYYKNSKKIHFRHHNKNKHNAIIVGEDNKNFNFIKVTHTPKKDKTHRNNKFKKNPNRLDKRDSYYENIIRIDIKDNFHNKPIKSWFLSKEDLKDIENLLKKKKIVLSDYKKSVQFRYSTSMVWFFNSLLEHINSIYYFNNLCKYLV